ncbi:PRC-barrel domain-containing protein [Streptosporangium subroseum]|uniref:PRC-barrel domain-containing protein n=1 Tax=Streptosporangium subroseum TaxID=106412 RepID=UPI001FE7C336|nr:PRC-barrel domain-containing protein [Streptosporangium subroseum]
MAEEKSLAMTENVWDYRSEARSGDQALDLVGFDVEATDGKIGSVDEESNAVGDSYVVVDTGFWIFGKKVVLPAGTVTRIDPQERKVYISRTKEEIKNAPEFDEATYKEPDYRDKLGGYYGIGPGPGAM